MTKYYKTPLLLSSLSHEDLDNSVDYDYKSCVFLPHKSKYTLVDLEFQSNFHGQSFSLKDIFIILLIHSWTLLNSHSVTNAKEHSKIHISFSNKEIDLAYTVF